MPRCSGILLRAVLTPFLALAAAGLSSSATPLASGMAEAAACPCTTFGSGATPALASEHDTNAVELGVKFRVGQAGAISAIRFYRGRDNPGPHAAHLWSASGALLATASFGAETAADWQQANLPSPVAVAANTTYVASYDAPSGGYAQDEGYFAAGGRASGPLTAPGSGADGPNGAYRYGAGGSPTDSWNATNYWVDVVFVPTP
jgi:hypothetical protein